MEERNRWILEQIAGDSSLTDYLDDVDAMRLLDWGSSLAQRLVLQTSEMDDGTATAFLELRLQDLRRMVRRINRLVGELQDTDVDEAVEQLQGIFEETAGQSILAALPAQDMAEFVRHLQALPQGEALAKVLAIVEGGNSE